MSRVATPKIAILQADSQDVLLVGLVEVIESPSTIKWLVGFRIVGFGLIMLLGIAGIILTNFHKIAIALNHERCSPRSISDRVRFISTGEANFERPWIRTDTASRTSKDFANWSVRSRF